MCHFKSRVPVWFRGDSTLIDPLPFWKKALRKLLLTQVYRSVDRAFYVGKANKRYFLWAGSYESQLNYAPHAVDNDYFMRDDEARMEMAAAKRRELGIDPDATVFLFVGKLVHKAAGNVGKSAPHASNQRMLTSFTLDLVRWMRL